MAFLASRGASAELSRGPGADSSLESPAGGQRQGRVGLSTPRGCQLCWRHSKEHRGPSLTSRGLWADLGFSRAGPCAVQMCSPPGRGWEPAACWGQQLRVPFASHEFMNPSCQAAACRGLLRGGQSPPGIAEQPLLPAVPIP